jgi:hypothetical protein
MGLVTMSERDLKRIEVLAEVLAGRRTVVSAAGVLAVGVRQTFRLLARYEEQGGGGLVHKARGRASNRQTNAGVREYAVELVRSRYADFVPTLATEVLLDKHGVKVGRETLRRWMVADVSGCHAAAVQLPSALLRRECHGNWSRSTAANIAGLSDAASPARFWCLSTMRRAG